MHEELFSFPKERANPRTERTSFVEERHARREWEIFTRNVKFLSSVLQVDLRVFGTHFRSTCSPFRVFDCWVNRGDEALVRNGVNNHHVAGSLSVSPSRLGKSSPLLRSNLAKFRYRCTRKVRPFAANYPPRSPRGDHDSTARVYPHRFEAVPRVSLRVPEATFFVTRRATSRLCRPISPRVQKPLAKFHSTRRPCCVQAYFGILRNIVSFLFPSSGFFWQVFVSFLPRAKKEKSLNN